MKERREKIKTSKEKKGLQKLIQNLELGLKREIFGSWLEYEKMSSWEGRFVKQGEKIETLLQALAYWGTKPDTPVFGWWEEVGDLVDHPILLEFLEKIEKRFYERKRVDGEIDFLLKMGKLKTLARKIWLLQKVKNPETVGEYTFFLTIASWIFGKKRGLNLEKLLKMSLIYGISKAYSLRKLILRLPADLQKEIIELGSEGRETLEGKFVNQLSFLVTYLQALQYFQENKKFPILAWFKKVGKFIDLPELLELKKEMERRFLPKRAIFSMPRLK